MPKNVIYARKSSESEDRQILSIDAQVREMRELARRSGVAIDEVLTETRSAKAPGRPIFDGLMRRVYRGEISAICSWKMDRLARNPKDSGNLLHALGEGLVQQIITIDGVKTSSGNDRLMGSVELAFATKFIDDLRANTKRGLEERLRNGWATYVPPVGYLNDVINHTIVSDPKRLPIVRKIFERFLSGAYRAEQVRIEANEQWGFRTVQRKRIGGRPLSRAMLYRMLGNPFYAGLIPSKGRLVPGKHEPIVTWEEFQRVQNLLQRTGQRRPKRHGFAFTGIFRCGRCGGAMSAEEHVKQSGKRYVYYRCCRMRTLGEPCTSTCVPEREIVDQLSRVLGRLTIPTSVLAWLKRKAADAAEADRARGQIVKRALEDNLRDTERQTSSLLDLRIRSVISDEVFKAKNNELEQRKGSLTTRLSAFTETSEAVARQVSELLDFAANVQRLFVAGPAVRQRAILEAVGSNYRLEGKKVSFQLEKPLSLISEAGGCSNWQRTGDDVRTWFLTTTEYFRIPKLHELSQPANDTAAQTV